MPRSSWLPALLRTPNRAALRTALRVEGLEDRWVPTGLDAIDDSEVVVRYSGPAAINAIQNDVGGIGEITITGFTQGSEGGKVLFIGGKFEYAPNLGFVGTETFTYTIQDGDTLQTDTATVTVMVIPGNTPPTAGDISDGVAKDAWVTTDLGLAASDPDGDGLTVVAYSQGSHGSVIVTGLLATYTPAPDYAGTDTYTYTVDDGNGSATTGTVTITITPVNDAPVALGASLTTAEDATLTGTVGGSDAEGSALTAVLASIPTHGTLVLTAAGAYTYTPAPNYHGPDSFEFRLYDGTAFGTAATVAITVTAVNDAPTSTDDDAIVAEDGVVAVPVRGNDTDADGDSLTVTAITQGAHGTVSHDSGAVTYIPTANFHGSDSFTYTVADGHGGTAAATVRVAVGSVNDAPTVAAGSYETAESTPLSVGVPGVLEGAADVDGDTFAATLVSGPGHGTLVLNANGSFAYTPAAGYHGPDSFTVRVSDGHGGTADAVVAVTVTPAAEPAPTAEPLPAGTHSITPAAEPAPVVVMPVGGGSTTVRVMNPDGSVRFAIDPFPGFGGRVGLATADVTGDRVSDIVIGAGMGGGPVVKVFDGATGAELLSFAAYDPSFRGGVHVAAADLTGDGVPDIVAGAGDGGAPHVKVFDGRTGAELRSFFAFDSSYRGGVNVANGDMSGDGRADVVAAVAGDGAPHVKVFDGATGAEMMSFFAFPVGFTGGVRVAVGDLDGDGAAEVVVGAGPGGGPVVAVYSGRTGVERARFMAFDSSITGGIDVAVRDIGGHPKLVVSAGPATAVYDGHTLALEDEFVVGGPAV